MELTKDQQSILLYCETCLVDQTGRMESIRMNDEDFRTLAAFQDDGVLDYGRIKMREIKRLAKSSPSHKFTHWVSFTPEAWTLTHTVRRERSARIIARAADESAKRGESIYGEELSEAGLDTK